jgi:hypothetical protein
MEANQIASGIGYSIENQVEKYNSVPCISMKSVLTATTWTPIG